ncbi:degV domain-containing protein [Desulfoluna limicola]|uniref:DegV domain-containing protein n=1 Tax=Desulfoluna limicola TaxID=2810562 RepID=A0ABN6FD72_9BACT|nr:DegV family protein [Desulfoluna limicola]BCS98735.1 degV domain-containing protein [Desulfoluna limicola]
MGQRIAIVTDSTADFPKGVAEKLGINMMPVHVIVDGVEYLDGETITTRQLVERMRTGASVSTRPAAPGEYANLFESLLERYDRVLSFQLSTHLSECYESAKNALSLLHPDDAKRVDVFDTGTLSIGQAIYTIMAIRYLKSHGRIEGMKETLDASVAASVNNITVDKLTWLRKSGKMGALTAVVGKMLDIKPIIALRDGRLTLVNRVRGMSHALDEMAAYAGRVKGDGSQAWEVWVGHCDAEENAFYLRNRLAEALGKESRTIRVVEAGASISVKVGPGSCCWGMVPL